MNAKNTTKETTATSTLNIDSKQAIEVNNKAIAYLELSKEASLASNKKDVAKEAFLKGYQAFFKAVHKVSTKEITFSESKSERASLAQLVTLNLADKAKASILDLIKKGKVEISENKKETIWKELSISLPEGVIESTIESIALNCNGLNDDQITELMKQITTKKVKDHIKK